MERIRGVIGALALVLAAGANAATVVVNFDSVSTAGGTVSGAAVVNYFATFGVTFSAGDPSVQPVVLTAAPWEPAPSAPNIFGTTGPGDGFTYTLKFANPVGPVSFTRPTLIATTPSGVTMATWSATAYDAANNPLGSVGEPLLASFGTIPAQTFTLTGPGIDHIVFFTNVQNFAGSNLIFDNLTFTTSSTITGCDPGSVIPVSLEPQHQSITLTNIAKGIIVQYGQLDLEFQVAAPQGFGALCSATSNNGALPVDVLFLAGPVPVALQSVTTATMTVFDAGATGPLSTCDFAGVANNCILNGTYDPSAHYVRWQSNGFSTQLIGWALPGFNTGPLNYWVNAEGIGLSGTVSMSQVVNAADRYIHVTLIDHLPAIAWYTIAQDPGNVVLSLTDEQGRSTGVVGGNMLLQIPGSFYLPSDTNPAVLIANAPAGAYSLGVTGTNSGPYALSVAVADMRTSAVQQANVTGDISQGETVKFNMQLDGSTSPSLTFSAGFDGGGQRPRDVNKLLSYINVTGTSTDLPLGATSFALNVVYGRTVVPSTFTATLNGTDISAQFNVVPGTSQMVTLPLGRGRNVLELGVQGLVGTRTVADKDRLVFSVP